MDAILTYLAPFKDEGLVLEEFSPGGGFAIGYLRDRLPPSVGAYAGGDNDRDEGQMRRS